MSEITITDTQTLEQEPGRSSQTLKLIYIHKKYFFEYVGGKLNEILKTPQKFF